MRAVCRYILALHVLSLLCEAGILVCTVVFALGPRGEGHEEASDGDSTAPPEQGTIAFAFLGVSAVCSVLAFIGNIAGARAMLTAVRKLSERMRVRSQLAIQVCSPLLHSV